MWQFNSTLAFLFTSFGYFYGGEQDDLVVSTNYGDVRGGTGESRDGRSYYKFLGIPFAKSPIEDLRFKEPQLPLSWEGVRDATKYGSQCIQVDMLTKMIVGEEDCLFLNIFTHEYQTKVGNEHLPPDSLKPVIVFFHGGGFMFGGSNPYKPIYFMDKDIVLVIINYRLGSFGFLNMGTEDIQGNMGLKDQTMALKYVKENIHNFGGDPNKVTIVGESAGSASVHYHMLSPMSKGLFTGAISQSGTSLSPWALMQNPLKQAERFVHRLNCTSPKIEEVSFCLRNLSSSEIIQTHLEITDSLHERYGMFGPSIETVGEERFLNDHPVNIIKSGKVMDVPWMNGVNEKEGLMFSAAFLKNETVRDAINSDWTKWIPRIFRFEDEPQKVEISNKIREYYLGSMQTNISMDNYENFTLFISDWFFFDGLHRTALLHEAFTHSPIYLYNYDYEGVFSLGKIFFEMTYHGPAIADLALSYGLQMTRNIFGMKEPHYGACHGDELALLFHLPFQPIHKRGSYLGVDYKMSENMIHIWTEFATHGRPPQLGDDLYWPPLNVSTNDIYPLKMMQLSEDFEVIDEPFHSRAEFWKSLNFSDIYVQYYSEDNTIEN